MMSAVAQTCPGPHALPLLSALFVVFLVFHRKCLMDTTMGQATELRVGWEQEARCHYMIFILFYLIQIGLALTM